MPSQHKYPPISVRLPEADRAWVADEAGRTGRPVNQIVVEAVARYRTEVEADAGRKDDER